MRLGEYRETAMTRSDFCGLAAVASAARCFFGTYGLPQLHDAFAKAFLDFLRSIGLDLTNRQPINLAVTALTLRCVM